MSAEVKKTTTPTRRHTIARRVLAPVTVACVGVSAIAALGSLPAAAAGSATVPFGSHTTAYAAGTIKPSAAQSTMDSATLAFYGKWKSRYLVSACGSGSAISSPDADHPFVAEAQGYGLEIFALMAGADPDAQASFDSVLKFVLAHPSSITPGLLAAEQDSSCKSVNGSDSATDGDLAVAYGLLLADRQWGSAGTYNYKGLAVSRINAIKAGEINPTTHLPLLGDWSSPGDKYYNSTRPSDFMIDHFRAFKAATGDATWDQVIAATSGLVTAQQNTYAPATGLIADFIVSTNTTSPKPAAANFLEGSTDGQYSYNSVRVPWHLGADGAVFANAASKAQSQRLTAWIKAKVGNDPTKVRAGYKLDGTTAVSYLDPEFVATLGPAAMNDASNQAWLDAVWNYTAAAATGSGIDTYYGSSLILQSMIVMSGNFWNPAAASAATSPTATATPTPTATSTPTPTPTPTATATPTPTPAPSTSALSVTFRYDEKWSNGWCGSLLVKNNGSTSVSKYTMGFDLPTTVNLSDKWNGTFSRSGTRFTLLSATGQSIAAGQTNSSTGFCVDRLRSSVLKSAVPTNLTAVLR
jgi:endo-1,4-beta-D-glucanase Y